MYQVVIVEDDPMVAMINRRYVEKDIRFTVAREFSDGRSALDYLLFHQVDLVILDMYMPSMSGIEMLRRLRAADIGTDVIMITAASDTPTVEKAISLGAVDYLVKPFEYQRFCQALDGFVRRREMIHGENVSQRELDELLNVTQNGASSLPHQPAVPKGIQEKTLQYIRLYLHEQTKGQTCEQIASGVGLSAVTVRHYMNYLSQNGAVVSNVDYSTGGRPSVVYTLVK